MLHPTRAVVLNYIRYRETSIVVRCYTEAFGVQSYVVNSVRTARGSAKIAYYQPLSLLSLIAYHREGVELSRLSQVQFFDPTLIPSPDIRKSSIRLFLSEVLTRVVQEQEANPEKFEYIFTSLLAFEHAETHLENFHLQFLLGLARRLGFGVSNPTELYNQIYGLDALFGTASGLAHAEEQEALKALLNNPYFEPLGISSRLRRQLLEDIVRYYRRHIEGMPVLKSLEVLQEIFS